MKDTNKHSFEEEFKKVFEEAEATPSPVLWAEIDAHLANQEAASYKRRLLYFKLRAAAAVVIIFGFLGVWFLNSETSSDETPIAASSQSSAGISSSQEKASQGNENLSGEDSVSNAVAASGNSQIETNKEMAAVKPEAIRPDVPATSQQEKIANSEPDKKTTLESQPNTVGKQVFPDAPLALSSEKMLAEDKNQTVARNNSSGENSKSVIIDKSKKNTSGKNAGNRETEIANDIPSGKQSIGDNTRLANGNTKNGSVNENTGELSNPTTSSTLIAIDREAYFISRMPLRIAVEDKMYSLEAPSVQTKADPYPFWLEEEEKQNKKSDAGSRWSLALAFTPSQFDPNMQVTPSPASSLNAKSAFSAYNASTNLSTGQTANMGSPVSQDLQNAENYGLSYNLGVNVQYALSEKFSLQSGLQYMHNNSQITTDNYLEDFSNRERYPVFLTALGVDNAASALVFNNATMDSQPIVSSPAQSGFSPNTNVQRDLFNTYPGVTQVLVQSLYQYMSIPLRLQYKLFDKKLSTSIGAGLSADIFLKNTVGNTDANVPEVEFNRQNNNIYKSIGLSGLLSARLNYQFSGKYSLYVEPSYRAALSSFTKSAEIRSMPNSFGVGTGLQYRF